MAAKNGGGDEQKPDFLRDTFCGSIESNKHSYLYPLIIMLTMALTLYHINV
ncbi:transmembrane protein, putative [Medicago truncatula]|uniref:Transmembrane protein, putative n=1 Tax=Medicago truncatula TaxID=3880 RepID=G8A1D2_MEDTR|nr:transmembrane protein, putative [Medicago truncatula]